MRKHTSCLKHCLRKANWQIWLFILLSVGLTLAVWITVCGAAERDATAKPLVIRASANDPWGGRIEDVEKVLSSTAATLWKHFPERELPPILVAPKGGPITLYKRGANGEIQVKLNTGNRLWAQHAFQFAHEFGHILCNYEPGENRNKWFEESLCEVASLFALRRMSETWQTAPPYPNWKDYAPSLAKYADERTKAAKPTTGTFVEWYREHAEQFTREPTNREQNLIVATQLLPLFEKQPEHWEAVTYLNDGKLRPSQAFAVYLTEWRRRCPAKHQGFVEEISRQFAVTVPLENKP